jgi:hypothetical protein
VGGERGGGGEEAGGRKRGGGVIGLFAKNRLWLEVVERQPRIFVLATSPPKRSKKLLFGGKSTQREGESTERKSTIHK